MVITIGLFGSSCDTAMLASAMKLSTAIRCTVAAAGNVRMPNATESYRAILPDAPVRENIRRVRNHNYPWYLRTK